MGVGDYHVSQRSVHIASLNYHDSPLKDAIRSLSLSDEENRRDPHPSIAKVVSKESLRNGKEGLLGALCACLLEEDTHVFDTLCIRHIRYLIRRRYIRYLALGAVKPVMHKVCKVSLAY